MPAIEPNHYEECTKDTCIQLNRSKKNYRNYVESSNIENQESKLVAKYEYGSDSSVVKKSFQLNYCDVLHRKCPVIKLIRNQIKSLESLNVGFLFNNQQLAGYPSVQKLWERKGFIVATLLPILIWCAVVCGALIGTSRCGGVINPHALY